VCVVWCASAYIYIWKNVLPLVWLTSLLIFEFWIFQVFWPFWIF
jgi:hypothetical protein